MPKNKKKKLSLKKYLKAFHLTAKSSVILIIVAVFALAAILLIPRAPKSASRTITPGQQEETSEPEAEVRTLKIYSDERPDQELAFIEQEDGYYVECDALNAIYTKDALFFDANEGKIFHTTVADGKQVEPLNAEAVQEMAGALFLRLDYAAEVFSLEVQEVDEYEIRLSGEPMEDEEFTMSELPKTPIVMTWFQDYSLLFNEEKIAKAGGGGDVVNVFAPTWYTLDENGEILSYVNAEWVAWAHEQGYQVWAMFDNEGDNDRAYAAIATESGREEVIAYLLAQCEELGLDGINVDFEILSEDTAACLIEFVRELGAVLRPKGYILSVDVSVPQAWSYYYRRDLLAKASDYIIVMAYDEHYSGGDAGSVSSMQFTSSAIDDMLLQVPSKKLILGIPFYTRIWYVSAEGTSSEAWGMNRTQTYIEENKLEPVLDESTGQDYVTRTVDQVEEKIWIENERSVRARVEMASDAGLAGVACWKIGLEKEETWDWIRESLGQ